MCRKHILGYSDSFCTVMNGGARVSATQANQQLQQQRLSVRIITLTKAALCWVQPLRSQPVWGLQAGARLLPTSPPMLLLLLQHVVFNLRVQQSTFSWRPQGCGLIQVQERGAQTQRQVRWAGSTNTSSTLLHS